LMSLKKKDLLIASQQRRNKESFSLYSLIPAILTSLLVRVS
jgi:hypothetical protein